MAAANQLSDKYSNIGISTPEEDAEFARIERNQEVAMMAAVVRTARTTSAEAVAERLFEAGYRFDSSAVGLPLPFVQQAKNKKAR